MAFVSVAIPIVKTQFIDASITSVLNQTYQNFELILVNNGFSETDKKNIRERCSCYNDSRIKYYENVNKQTIIDDWNRCLALAQYDLFVLFSDDDEYEPDFLEELVALSNKMPNTNVFHTRIMQIDEESNIVTYGPSLPEHESVLNAIWHTVKGYRLQFAPEFMCRTSKLREIGGFYDLPLAWGSDYITWFTVGFEGGIGFVNKPLCKWRVSRYNLSSVGNINERIKAVLNYKDWLQKFVDNYQIGSTYERRLLNEIKKNSSHFFDEKILFLLCQATAKQNIVRSYISAVKYKKIFHFNNHLIKKLSFLKLKQMLILFFK